MSTYVPGKRPRCRADSHKTVSKNSSRCRFLIGHEKCFVLLCPIGEQFLGSPFREFVHTTDITPPLLPGSRTRRVRARETFIFYFPNHKGRNYRWVEKRLGCYQQEQFNLPWEYSVFDGSQCILNNRKFKMRRRRESRISNSFTRKNNNYAHASHFFVHFFAVNCSTTRENA